MSSRMHLGKSPELREQMRHRAIERGAARSNEVRARVQAAMRLIEQEVDANDGVYPANKGTVSGAEVARRAGVHGTTLFSPKQRELGEEVKRWIDGLKNRKVVVGTSTRRGLTERVADWRAKYQGLAQSHRDTELELQQLQHLLEKANRELEVAAATNAQLRQLLSEATPNRVVPIRPSAEASRGQCSPPD